MTPVIIVLIVIGVIFLIVSCFLVEKTNTNKMEPNVDKLLDSSEIDKETIKNTLEHTLNEVTEETLHKTDVELGKLSNETIMVVNDFSNQVLEKINKNHEEVVFLYQMLNDKEEQLKKLLGQVDESKKSLSKEVKQVSDSVQAVRNNSNIPISNENNSDIDSLIVISSIHKDELESNIEDNQLLEKDNLNNNQRIINLYKAGKSVMEIARELELGQGEVKLVLDLFVK